MKTLILPLALTRENKKVKIKKLLGGRGLARKLIDLGLKPGKEVSVIRNQMSGPIIVSLNGGGQIAIGRGLASKIYVEELIYE